MMRAAPTLRGDEPVPPAPALSTTEFRRLTALVVAATAAYSAVSILRHWHFGSGGWDLGIQEQAIWQMSRLQWPFSSFQNIPYFADHFSPVLVLVVPLYWLWPRAETLLVAQAAALALAAVPVFIHARVRLTAALAWIITVAYLFFWGVQRAVLFDFHELALAAPFVAWAVVGIEWRRWRLLAASLALLLLVKEDQTLVVIGFGGLLALRGYRRAGCAAAAAGTAVLAAVVLWWFPVVSGGGPWEDAFRYQHLLEPTGLLAGMLGHPQRLELLLMYVGPWLFLPLLSPLSLAAVPLVLSRLLSSSPQHWMAAFHYTAPLAPLLAMAAADGWARLRAGSDTWRGPARTRAIAAAVVLIAVLQPGSQSVLRLLDPSTYRFQAWELLLPEVKAVVPADASLVVQDSLAPHFSQRQHIYTLDGQSHPARFVVACRHADTWPNTDWAAVESLLAHWRLTHDAVFEREGWIVLRERSPLLDR